MPVAPLVIVNPTAGGGRALRLLPWLRERLASRPDARLEITSRRGHAEALAREETAAHDRIVAVGGDGTVQEVVNGVLGTGGPRPSIGIVPVGRGNDLARSLGLPPDPGEAWRAAIGSGERVIDAARATAADGRERWFASAGGIGFDAQVADAMSARRGWLAGRAGYLVTTLLELRRFSNRRVVLAVDDEHRELDVLLLAIANGPFYGGGMRIAPPARVDDGRLDVCVVGDVSRLTAVRQLPNLYRGTHVTHPAVELLTGRGITVDGDAATLTHLDGEPFGALPIRVEAAPGVLAVASTQPRNR